MDDGALSRERLIDISTCPQLYDYGSDRPTQPDEVDSQYQQMKCIDEDRSFFLDAFR